MLKFANFSGNPKTGSIAQLVSPDSYRGTHNQAVLFDRENHRVMAKNGPIAQLVRAPDS